MTDKQGERIVEVLLMIFWALCAMFGVMIVGVIK
jgi:hypothetical protein